MCAEHTDSGGFQSVPARGAERLPPAPQRGEDSVARSALALLTTAVLLTCAGCGAGAFALASPAPTRSTPALEEPAGEAGRSRPYSMLQMNSCLSGVARCFSQTVYPAVVDEAVHTIRAERPEAVSLNEACSDDAAEIARRAGYHVRFAAVSNGGAPLPCAKPGGRGVFGNAVLTQARIVTSHDQAFASQAGVEERRWICVTTSRDVTACSAHLSSPGSRGARRANREQCAELAALLLRYAELGATIFAGDVNRVHSCAPEGSWKITDAGAAQAPGIQHLYGTHAFTSPRGTVVPAAHTDHDYLRVDARLAPRTRTAELG